VSLFLGLEFISSVSVKTRRQNNLTAFRAGNLGAFLVLIWNYKLKHLEGKAKIKTSLKAM
jgi:hypothetical protein